MYKIINKQVQIVLPFQNKEGVVHEKPLLLTYSDIIEACLSSHDGNGWNYEQLVSISEIEKQLYLANNVIDAELEFTEQAFLSLCIIVRQMKWHVRSEEIIKFVEDIINTIKA